MIGLRAGDPHAFTTVYEALAPSVLGYLRAHGAPDPEALTQEVFLTVFRRARELHGGEAGLRTFAFSVAHARRVDDLRQRSRRTDDAPYDVDVDPRTTPAAEDEVMEREGAGRVQALLATLPPAQREVVSLRVVAGLSLEETAAAIDRSVGAVKQLQRRGLLALREAAEGEGRNS